jgi:hypothetical protein
MIPAGVDLLVVGAPCQGYSHDAFQASAHLNGAIQVREQLAGIDLDLGATLALEDVKGLSPIDRPARLPFAVRAGDGNLKNIDHFDFSLWSAA